MEDVFKDPVQLSKGIKLQELLNGEAEFHIDIDFKKTESAAMLNCDDDLFPDLSDGDSDSETYFKNIEDSTSKFMLSCPEYNSFADLGANMIDCIPGGDVKMLIIEEGKGPLVPVDANVTLHYAAYFEKATIPFDSTLIMNPGQPLQIRLGSGSLIPGLEIGLTAVRGPQARFNLLLQPALAWGAAGVLPRIRPEPALFVITLYDVTDTQAAVRFNDLPMAEQRNFEVTMRTVKALHGSAKNLFNKKNYKKAIKNYQQSISVLRVSEAKDEKEGEELKKLKINTHVNLAVCYYKISKPKYVINMCESLDFITDIDTHCKALFYYGRAYEMLGKDTDAIKYYKKALKLEPKNQEIGKALAAFNECIKTSGEKEKEIWRKAFQSTIDKNRRYDVDEEFQKVVLDMCKDLEGREGYAKLDLPKGLNCKEVDYLRDMCAQFKSLTVLDDGKGSRRGISIVRKSI